MGVRHFTATVRGRLGDLPVGSFRDTPLHERLSQPSPFDQTRPEPLPPDPTTTAEVHRCGANMAEFFSLTIGPVIGDAFRAFNEECLRLSCHQQGVTARVYVSYLRAALHRIDRNVDRTIAGVKDVAALTGRRLGTGSAGLGSWTDFCMAPGPHGGTVLISPVDGLGVGDPRGVLLSMVRAQKLQLEVVSASLAQQEIDRQRDLAQKELDRLQLEAISADLAQQELDRQLTVGTREPGGARAKGYPVEETTIQTPALDDRKMEPQVPLEAQEDGSGFAQALDADREKQAALVADRAAAIATAAKATKAAEEATEHAATLEAVVAKQRQFVGELEAEHARALLAAEQVAEARWRDRYDASAVEKGELAAQLQAEAGANAALRRERRELRQAGAVTSVREAEETVAAETATAKAGEGRISSLLGRHAVIPESDPGIQFGSGAPAGEDPPLISFGTVDSAPGGASAVDSVGRVPRGSDTPASGTSAISDEPQAKSVTKSAPTSAKPGGAKSATKSAPTSAQPGEAETQSAPTGAKPGEAETQAKSAQKAPRQSPKPNDVKARVTRAKPSAHPGGDKAPGERAKQDQAKSAKPSAKPGPIRSGVDGRSPGGTSDESPSGLTRGQKKALARRRAAERAAQTALLAARDEAGSRDLPSSQAKAGGGRGLCRGRGGSCPGGEGAGRNGGNQPCPQRQVKGQKEESGGGPGGDGHPGHGHDHGAARPLGRYRGRGQVRRAWREHGRGGQGDGPRDTKRHVSSHRDRGSEHRRSRDRGRG